MSGSDNGIPSSPACQPADDDAMSSRLDALVAQAGWGSRSMVGKLIRSGAVAVDGAVCRDRARQITESAAISVHGQTLVTIPRVVLLHKASGYACSRDQRESPLVFDLLPETWRSMEPAGRLDRNTTGLLIFSRDGALLHRLVHPKHHLPRRYRVRYDGQLPDDAVQRCADGMLLDGDERPTKPAQLLPHRPGYATLILHEGRFHQVKRMFVALDAQVTDLHRDRIGALSLPDDLPVGASRPADDHDIETLFTMPQEDT